MYRRTGILVILFAAFLVCYNAATPLSAFDRSASAAPATFTISGLITEGTVPNSGPGIAGVTVTLLLRPSTQTTTSTDSNGNFSFANVPSGSDFEVTPSKAGWVFQPTSQGGILDADRTLFFTATSSSPTPTPTPTPTPVSLQWSSATYITPENVGSLTVTVNRTGSASAAATVHYATSDNAGSSDCNVLNTGFANSRCDYETTIGTLNFAPGETSKPLLIPIIDDVWAEGNESFMITLSAPTGAVLGSPSVATVTIIDNDSTTGTNPISQADFFVRMHYIDFFTREPDAGGLAFWSNQITECQQPGATCNAAVRRINVSAAFFLSIEFQETGYLVERLYKTAYGDNTSATSKLGGTSHSISVPIIRLIEFLPDTQQIGRGVVVGQSGWELVLENNKVALIAEFVQRQRFTGAFPTSLTPMQFVDMLFANAGVTPTAAERQSAIDEFGVGTGNSTDASARARALRRVAENSTLNQQEKNRAFVLMQFYGYLRRNPNDAPDTDYTGYDFWLGKLNQFNGNFVDAEMVKAFLVSGEYIQRFGP